MHHTFNCQNCGKVNKIKKNTKNKFCDNICQAQHRWVTETVPKIEAGNATSNSSKTLKKYLIEKNGEQCVECGVGTVYNNKPLSLQLDHIDGNSDNNRVENLRLLCPNCHSQTVTYGSKGKGNRYKKDTERNKYLREYKTSLV